MKHPKRLKLPTSYELVSSPHGDRVAALGRNVVTGDTLLMKRLTSCHPLSHPSHACFNSDGSKLAVKGTSGRIVIVDPITGKIEVDFKNDLEGEGANVVFSADGSYLIDGSWKGQIFVRSVDGKQIDQRFNYAGEMITDVSCSKEGQRWAFLHQPKVKPGENEPIPPYISLWQWPLAKAEILRFDFGLIEAAVLAPDGESLAVAGISDIDRKMSLRVINLSGKIIRSVVVDDCKSLCWSSCGTILGRVGNAEIVIHSSVDLTELKSYPLRYPSSVCFAPDLSFIGLGSWEAGIVEPFEHVMPNMSFHPTPQTARRG